MKKTYRQRFYSNYEEIITLKKNKLPIIFLRKKTVNYKTISMDIPKKCIPRSKKDIGALKKGHSALKRGQLKNCQI